MFRTEKAYKIVRKRKGINIIYSYTYIKDCDGVLTMEEFIFNFFTWACVCY